MLIFLH